MENYQMKIENKKENGTTVGKKATVIDGIAAPGKSLVRKRTAQSAQIVKPHTEKTVTQKAGATAMKRKGQVTSGEVTGPTYKDDLAAAIHEGLAGLTKIGVVNETVTRSFENVALKTVPQYTGELVRELRHRENATQAVFALHLGVSVNTVSQWERDEREVTGAAAKLLSLVEKRGLAYLV